jgi:hypothetical protein
MRLVKWWCKKLQVKQVKFLHVLRSVLTQLSSSLKYYIGNDGKWRINELCLTVFWSVTWIVNLLCGTRNEMWFVVKKVTVGQALSVLCLLSLFHSNVKCGNIEHSSILFRAKAVFTLLMWRTFPAGMLHCVAELTDSDVLTEHSAFVCEESWHLCKISEWLNLTVQYNVPEYGNLHIQFHRIPCALKLFPLYGVNRQMFKFFSVCIFLCSLEINSFDASLVYECLTASMWQATPSQFAR